MVREIKRFDNWFSSSYNKIRDKIRCYTKLNDDVFHDTYLFIRISLLFERSEIIDFERYFIGCYKKVALKRFHFEQRYYHPDESFFLYIAGDEPISIDDLMCLDKLAHDILNFVKKHFPHEDYSLFRFKHFDTRCSYKDLSDYSGVPPSTIYRKVNSISKTVRENKDFTQRKSKLSVMNY